MTALATRLGPRGAVARRSVLRRRFFQHVLTVVLALFVSRRLGVIGSVPPEAVLAVPPGILVLYLFLKHPKWCLLALIGTTCFGLYRYGIRIGPLTVRGNDPPLLFLIPWALLIRARSTNRTPKVLAQQYIGLFIGAIAFTLVFALVRQTDDAPRLIVAWLRLLSTFSLVWIVPYVLREERDILFLLRAVAVCISAELFAAIVREPAVLSGTRMAGSNGPTVEGLLAATLVLMAIHSPVPSRTLSRVGMAVLGLASLYFASSIGSFAAMGIALGLFGLRSQAGAGKEARRKSGLLRPGRIILLLLGVVFLLNVLRPLDLPTSDYFKNSSAGSRLLVGVAGTKVFLDNPVFGVGWQRSSRPEVIASRDLLDELKQTFPDFNEDFFPDATSTVTVHNAYIQVLAETGVIGGAALGIAMVAVIRRIRRTLGALTGVAEAAGRMAAIIVLASVVWLNDNPLFGAQPETILLATMLGVLAALAATTTGRTSLSPAPPVAARALPAVAGSNGHSPRRAVLG